VRIDNFGEVITYFTEKIDLSRYVIFDCKEGVCRQTTGFMKNGYGVYAFVGVNKGKNVIRLPELIGGSTLSDETKCEEGNAGLLYYNKNGICINKEKGIDFADDDDNEYMILKGKTFTSGNPFEEAANINIRIKRSANYILKDNFYTSGL